MLLTRRTVFGVAGCAILSSCAGETPVDSHFIDVQAPERATNGILRFRGREFSCALGRAGIVRDKREGDGGTPAGDFPLREILFRPDRGSAPSSNGLPLKPLHETDGWCDSPNDASYNKPVRLPYPASAERMWREDHLYDLLAVIGYNDAPIVPGRGSAIFLHVARPGQTAGTLAPTVGCVALEIDDLRAILADVAPATRIRIRLT